VPAGGGRVTGDGGGRARAGTAAAVGPPQRRCCRPPGPTRGPQSAV